MTESVPNQDELFKYALQKCTNILESTRMLFTQICFPLHNLNNN